MTIHHDANSFYAHNNAPSIATWAHTVTALGTGRILLVGTSARFNPGLILTATYAGAAMTRLDSQLQNNNTDGITELWYIVNPATGVNNIVVDWAGGNNWVGCGGVSFTGVNVLDPFGTHTEGWGNGVNLSAPAVTAEVGWVVIDVAGSWHNVPSVLTVGAGQTERVNIVAPGETNCGMSTEPGAVAVNMTWTHNHAREWGDIAAPLKPLVVGRTRAAKYYFNIWDPNPRVRDAVDQAIPANELRGDTWLELQGAKLPTPTVYDSFIEDPSKARIIEVVDSGNVTLKASRSQFADVLIKRASAGRA